MVSGKSSDLVRPAHLFNGEGSLVSDLSSTFTTTHYSVVTTTTKHLVVFPNNTYNPESEKVGTVWKTQIKKESSDFKIYFDLYYIADNMNTKYFMFCLVNFMSFVNIQVLVI